MKAPQVSLSNMTILSKPSRCPASFSDADAGGPASKTATIIAVRSDPEWSTLLVTIDSSPGSARGDCDALDAASVRSSVFSVQVGNPGGACRRGFARVI
jgi:hypothetical protein